MNFTTTLFTAAAFTTAMGTTALAEDWQNTTYGIGVISGDADYSLDADESGLTGLEVGYTALEYSYGVVDANIRVALETDFTDEVSLAAQYNVSTVYGERFLPYATLEVDYNTNTSFDEGTFDLNPYAGVAYSVTDYVAVYGEVAYSWDMSNDFAENGGYVEVGAPVAVTETMMITPSVRQTFDTENDAADFRLETTFVF